MDLDQLEAFALSDDRDAVIAQLIPGTPDYYYYSCLLAQQRGDLEAVADLLEAWRERHGATQPLSIIENRQLVLLLDRQPDDVCENLRRRLRINFNHQREVELARGAHPSVLAPERVEWARLAKSARDRHPNQTSGFTDRGAHKLLDFVDLDHATRRHLLGRISRPDHPRLVQHIAADLEKRSNHFGSLAIHRLLLPAQLDELADLIPSLRADATWVECWLAQFKVRLDEDAEHDLSARREYLERMWQAVSPLGPSFSSLRAHVLYHLLEVHRRFGHFDRELFLTYLRLPRSVHYLSMDWRHRHRDHLANLGASFAVTGLPPIGDDERLVRDYLTQLLVDADDYDDLVDVVDSVYLRKLFATIKILAGRGDLERWHSLLDDSSVFAELKSRVDIELGPRNRVCFAADDIVEISARVKNVKTLTVNVFEINSTAYFPPERARDRHDDRSRRSGRERVAHPHLRGAAVSPGRADVPAREPEAAGDLRGRADRRRQVVAGSDPQGRPADHPADRRRRPGVPGLRRGQPTGRRRDASVRGPRESRPARAARSPCRSRPRRASGSGCCEPARARRSSALPTWPSATPSTPGFTSSARR